MIQQALPGVAWRDVRRPSDLDGLHGLILPGGESTTMWHILRHDGFAESLLEFARASGALYGTCAGAILLHARCGIQLLVASGSSTT